ncbi:MAG: S8 family serine peptidase [Candidatus Promineifilaceae bacterium]
MKIGPTKAAWPWLVLTLFVLLTLTVVSAGAAPASAPDPDSQSGDAASTGKKQSYVVLMDEWPLAAHEGAVSEPAGTKAAGGNKVDAHSAAAKRYESQLLKTQDAARERAGVSQSSITHSYTVVLNGFSAMMTEKEAEAMRRQDGVMLVMKDQWRQPMTDSSPSFLGLTGPRGAWHIGFDGDGVLVGIIDSGIWPEHPSFADDGTYPPAPELDNSERSSCDFGNTAYNPLDRPFQCNNKLVGARQMLDSYRESAPIQPDEYDSARDDFGHGTHAASVAIGNHDVKAEIFGIPRGSISGIAPRAQVIAYKALGEFGALSSDLAAAVDQAVADGVDVINYGSGGGAGEPGADEFALLFAANAGVFVATAAGNDGPLPATLTNPGTFPWMTTVGASTQPRFWQGTLVLGGDEYGAAVDVFTLDGIAGHGSETANCSQADLGLDGAADRHRKPKDGGAICLLGASITPGIEQLPLVDAEDAGSEFCVPGELDPAVVAGKIVLCRRGVVGRPEKSHAVRDAGGLGTILYNNSDDQTLPADEHWTPAIQLNYTNGLAVKNYIDAAGAAATARIIGDQVSTWPYAPSMADYSSRGPNPVAPDIIKPDLTAPGSQILGAWTPTPDPNTTPPGEYFAALDGTSFSSPHVAGAFALLKQAHPDWTPAMARSAVMTTAYQDVLDSDLVTPADPFDMGSGHLNLGREVPAVNTNSLDVSLLGIESMQSILKDKDKAKPAKPSQGARKGSAFEPGLVYDAGLPDYLGFLCEVYPEAFGDPVGTCAGLEEAGIPTTAVDLNYPSIGISSLPGKQTVKRTVTSVAKESGWRKYEAVVDAPPGYEVVVEPSTFQLKPGESATYEVTISNVSGPVGEWRFGSLSWRDRTRRYNVYSPIAVRGVLFDTPQEVDGSGLSGSGSFDVRFGYTGSYSALPHGMVPATVTTDTIEQDAQDVYQFDLNDALLFRVAMPPESTIDGVDIDIYVYDPDGNLAGLSESGGTNELVNIEEPMDGTWTVQVYGYLVPPGGVAYDMWTWAVPNSSGGSLSVDSAPATAVTGETGTVSFSWSGLAEGTNSDWYLGGISHTGDAGLLDVTVVNIDNR